jgi:thiamine-monophosphate kinase
MIDPESTLETVGERGLLAHLRTRIPLGEGVVVGVGDDAAAVATGKLTLVTCDALVEGTHFRLEWTPPRLLGRKALTISVSDVAAMGGVPRHAIVSLVLRPDLRCGLVDELFDGLLERAAELGVNLVGGNLAASDGPIVIDLTLLGEGDRLLRRDGGVAGDRLLVTGGLGAAAAGLRLLQHGARLTDDGELATTGIWTDSSSDAVLRCLRAQLDPSPPWALARSLAEQQIVHAAIDLSDGLAGDLQTLCEESGLGARIEEHAIPCDPHAARFERARGGDPLQLAMGGGEDYQLLMAVAADSVTAVRDAALMWGVPISDVGELIEGTPVVLLRTAAGVEALERQAFDHFRRDPSGQGGT